MNKLTAITIILLLSLATLLLPAPAVAQGTLSVTAGAVQVSFPNTITFNVSARSSNNIVDLRLHYQIERDHFTDVTSESYITVTPSTSISSKWTWDARRSGALPPGTAINYWWTAKDSTGNTAATPPAQVTVNDSRVMWKTLQQDLVTIYWYTGDNSFAQELMDSVQSSLANLDKSTGARITKPVRLYIYASSTDLRSALINANEWVGGVAFTGYSAIAIGISPTSLEWGKSAITHELTHLVVSQTISNPYCGIPVWLDEGLAMYSQGPMTSQFSTPLNAAILTNTLITTRSLASPFSADSNIANLSYAESYSMVNYLIATYGQPKMQELLTTFRNGNTYDGALQKVYGFDMDGLFSAWKTAITASPTK